MLEVRSIVGPVVFLSLNLSTTVARIVHEALLSFVPATTLLMGVVHLIERRGRHPEVTPSRRIDISTLVESMPEATFVFDASGNTVEANTAAANLLQANRSEMKRFSAESIAKFLAATPEGLLKPEQMVVCRSLQGETIHQERRVVKLPSSGATVEVLLSANPIRNDDGSIVGAMVIVRDVTELATLHRLMDDTERQNAIGKMAAALSHDFNNVLQSISQAVSVLEADPNRTTEERDIILRMVRNAVKRGTEITGSVRQYLAGGGNESVSVDVNTVLEETIELMRPLWESSRNISIVRHFQPVGRVRANVAELRRVFTNLVMNALEAMPRGGTLTIGCEQVEKRICAFVKDTGEGISPEHQGKIFIPYFTTKIAGTGLGLVNARRAINSMGGQMNFSTGEGKGTCFRVELPVLENPARVV